MQLTENEVLLIVVLVCAVQVALDGWLLWCALRHDENASTREERLERALRGCQRTIGEQAMHIGALEAGQRATVIRESDRQVQRIYEWLRQEGSAVESSPTPELPELTNHAPHADAGHKGGIVVPLRGEREP